MEIISKNAGQTKKLGQMLAGSILETKPGKQALVLALTGELGGGKTTFIQGLARGLGIRRHLTSPSFVIMKQYSVGTGRRPVPTRKNFTLPFNRLRVNLAQGVKFFHIDCYRLKNEKDLISLGIEEVLADSQNIVAIEWADRVKKILPKNRINIEFGVVDEKKRKIVLK